MKSLFTNISQEEKNRILEMHSAKKNVISEQSIFPSKKVTEGMTINLYYNSDESGQPQLSDKIITIKRGFNQDVSLIMSTDVSINFKCGDNWVTMNEIDKPSDENPRLYNKKLINSLTNQFCQSNKQGTTVPKADFAMNNQQTNLTTGVA